MCLFFCHMRCQKSHIPAILTKPQQPQNDTNKTSSSVTKKCFKLISQPFFIKMVSMQTWEWGKLTYSQANSISSRDVKVGSRYGIIIIIISLFNQGNSFSYKVKQNKKLVSHEALTIVSEWRCEWRYWLRSCIILFIAYFMQLFSLMAKNLHFINN